MTDKVQTRAEMVAEKIAMAKAAAAASVRTLIFQPNRGDESGFLEGLTMCGIKNRDTAHTLKEAIDRLIVQHYDLIIVAFIGDDSSVADQFVDELKNLEATASIPLIAVTTDGEPKNVLRIMSKGVNQALVLPFSQIAVREAIRGVLWPEKAEGITGLLHIAWNDLEEGDLDDARGGFVSIIEQDDACVDAKIGLATIMLQEGELHEGAELLKEAMKDAKKLSNIVQQYTLLSKIYHCMGDHFASRKAKDKAIKHYKAALKLNPYNISALSDLLSLMSSTSTIGAILTFLDEIKGDFAPFSNYLDGVAECLEGLLKRYQALNIQENVDRIFQYLANVDHNDSVLHIKTVDYLLTLPDGLCVAKEYLERITDGVRDTDVMCKLASLFVQVAELQVGNKAKLAGIDVSCFEPASREDLIRSAYDWYNESLMIDPFDAEIWMNLVRCHLWLKDEAKAQETLERCAESIDMDADALFSIGDLLVEEKAYLLAEDYIEEGVENHPKDSRFHLLQGKLYNVQKEHFKAVAALKTGLSENPKSVECMVELGRTYTELKKWTDAIEFYEKARHLNPEDPEIDNALQTALKQKYKK